ncbi:MAG: RNA polymerase sigma factor [Bacteroidota bacterium]
MMIQMPGQDDIYLIKQILAGDSQGYAELLDRYQTRVYNFVLYMLRSKEEAEEVVQDTFVNAFKSLRNFRQEAKFSTWLLRIAYNNSLTRLRKKRLTLVDIDSNDSFSQIEKINNISDQSDQQDIQVLLSIALNALSEDEKAVVSLFYYNELSIQEICDITGKKSSNVKIILHRSRQKMLEKLNVLGIKEWAS